MAGRPIDPAALDSNQQAALRRVVAASDSHRHADAELRSAVTAALQARVPVVLLARGARRSRPWVYATAERAGDEQAPDNPTPEDQPPLWPT